MSKKTKSDASPCPWALASFRHGVSELHAADIPVVIVFRVTFFLFNPAFLCFRNPKHTNLDSSWRNLDDLRTYTKKLMPLLLIIPSSEYVACDKRKMLLYRRLMKKSYTMTRVMLRTTMGDAVKMKTMDTITSILAKAIWRNVLAFYLKKSQSRLFHRERIWMRRKGRAWIGRKKKRSPENEKEKNNHH